MDGIEVMAVIFARKLGVTVGTFVMAYNVLLYIACGFAIGSWILPLYSIVTYAAALKTVDYIVDGLDRAKAAMIVTEKPDEICTALAKKFGSGMTRLEAKGGYSGENKTMIYFVVNRFQITDMKKIVHGIDKTAYITISEVRRYFFRQDGRSLINSMTLFYKEYKLLIWSEAVQEKTPQNIKKSAAFLYIWF